MRKVFIHIILGFTVLAGCQNEESRTTEKTPTEDTSNQSFETSNDNTPFPYPNLLSDSSSSYFLLTIGEMDEDHPIEEDKEILKNVNNILSLPTLKMAQKAYPELHLDKEPVYILFDMKGTVHQSTDVNELRSYLEDNN